MKVSLAAALVLSALTPLAARAQDEDYDDYAPTARDEAREKELEEHRRQMIEDSTAYLQGNHFSLLVVTPGQGPRLDRSPPRGNAGPWRILVRCDETTLDQSDTTAEETGWRRIAHAVLLVERASDQPGESYKITVEQMMVDLVRGQVDPMLALPATDPFRPIPARDGAALYTRVTPLYQGTTAALRLREAGWIRTLRFTPGENTELNYFLDLAAIARFIINACPPVPAEPVADGARWTFTSDEELDGHPTSITRTITLAPTQGDHTTLTQSFDGTVAQPDRAPAMFRGLDGQPKTFGSALTASGTSTWGKDCPLPIKATFTWTEDCTGTFETKASDDAPPRELTGRSMVRRTDEMTLLTETPGTFVEEGQEEVTDEPPAQPEPAPQAAPAEPRAEPQPETQAEPDTPPPHEDTAETLPNDLEKAGEYLDAVLTINRLAKTKPFPGAGKPRTWARPVAAKGDQRIEVRVTVRTMGSDILGVTEDTGEQDTLAVLRLHLTGEHDEHDFPKGVLTFESIEHSARDTDTLNGEVRTRATDEGRAWVLGLSLPFTVTEQCNIWIDQPPTSSEHLPSWNAVQSVLSAVHDAAIERPYPEQGVGAWTVDEGGDFGSATEFAHRRVTRDRAGASSLTLQESDLWHDPASGYLKIWGREFAPSVRAENLLYALRSNRDAGGLALPGEMTLNSLGRVRSTYLKDGREQVGEFLKSITATVRTLE